MRHRRWKLATSQSSRCNVSLYLFSRTVPNFPGARKASFLRRESQSDVSVRRFGSGDSEGMKSLVNTSLLLHSLSSLLPLPSSLLFSALRPRSRRKLLCVGRCGQVWAGVPHHIMRLQHQETDSNRIFFCRTTAHGPFSSRFTQ